MNALLSLPTSDVRSWELGAVILGLALLVGLLIVLRRERIKARRARTPQYHRKGD